MDKDTQQRVDDWRPDPADVERLAYFYYVERGHRNGSHEDDWRRAEQELRRRHEQGFASASAQRTVVGVFRSMNDAQRAFDRLHADGFSRDDISLVANNSSHPELTDRKEGSDEPAPDTGSDVGTDAGIGAAVGGVSGLLLSLAALAVPGVGPVLAAGPILAALGGAAIGAAAGGLIGALVERGVPREAAEYYAEGVRRGDVLVMVQASGDRADRAAEILTDSGAIDIDDRVSDWRSQGWRGYDAEAAPLPDEEIAREREFPHSADPLADRWIRETRRAARIY